MLAQTCIVWGKGKAAGFRMADVFAVWCFLSLGFNGSVTERRRWISHEVSGVVSELSSGIKLPGLFLAQLRGRSPAEAKPAGLGTMGQL
jgi:hypothetical protein